MELEKGCEEYLVAHGVVGELLTEVEESLSKLYYACLMQDNLIAQEDMTLGIFR
jgi:hypothetical protein